MDSSHDRRADDYDGARTVSNWELMMLSQEMKHNLEDILKQIGRLETANAQQFGEIQTWQGEYQTKVNTNSEEISKLRGHHHEMRNKMQTLLADSVLLSPEARRELVRLLPWAQMASKRQERREMRWFGLSREFVIGIIGIITLILANNGPVIWHAVFH